MLRFACLALLALLPLVAAMPTHRHHQPKAELIDASNIDTAFARLQAHEQFAHFKRVHGKSYESKEIEAHRFQIFQDNMQRAAELAKKNPHATFGVNQFSDIHPVEFKQKYLKFQPIVGDRAVLRAQAKTTPLPRHAAAQSIPASYDWRTPDQNRPVGVTAVKDQGQCGSCWAFSATEELESAWILAGNTPVALAPEQTVDCDTGDNGCNGGDTISAYKYIEANGVEAEASYPYVAGTSGAASTCSYNAANVVAKMKSFTYATPGCNDTCTSQDENLLAENLYHNGPVSICVDASTWQSYTGGILSAASGCQSAYTALDHCVQLVGYGVDATSGQKFWSVRNSWNTVWGEAGYIRLLFGANTCGVADEATQIQI